MTTTTIADLANKGSLATSEFQIQVELRRNVVPRYLQDLDAKFGKLWWRRGVWSFATVAGTRYDSVPLDFGWMRKLVRKGVTGGTAPGEIMYIGEREDDVIAAELNDGVATGAPTGYYIHFGVPQIDAVVATAVPRPRLWFDVTPDAVYNLAAVYQRGAYFADDSTEVDLDLYIPPEKQYPLVLLLRAAVYEDRYGSGDERFVDAMTDYAARLSTLGESEPASDGMRSVYMR